MELALTPEILDDIDEKFGPAAAQIAAMSTSVGGIGPSERTNARRRRWSAIRCQHRATPTSRNPTSATRNQVLEESTPNQNSAVSPAGRPCHCTPLREDRTRPAQ